MSVFGAPKVPKKHKPDTHSFTVFMKPDKPIDIRNGIMHMVLDPGTENVAIRISARSFAGMVVTVLFQLFRIAEVEEIESYKFNMMCNNLVTFLNKHSDYILACDLITLERQMPINYTTVRMSSFAIAHLIGMFKAKGKTCLIQEVDPKFKNKILGLPSGLKKRDLKAKVVELARELFAQWDDKFGLKVMDEHGSKQDDLGDTACIDEAIWRHLKRQLKD